MIDLDTGSSDNSDSFKFKKNEELDFRVWFNKNMRSILQSLPNIDYVHDEVFDDQRTLPLRDGVLRKHGVKTDEELLYVKRLATQSVHLMS